MYTTIAYKTNNIRTLNKASMHNCNVEQNYRTIQQYSVSKVHKCENKPI